ncbi:MAG: phosphatidate cytidylyltransferase [Bacteroidales bacterium]|nr:phosphatidate cytidylyltransferase [Bacteroidales bacterium]
MKKFIIRSISGVVYGVSIIASILLGKTTFGAILLLLNFLALFEFINIIKKKGYQPNKYVLLVSSVIVFLTIYTRIFYSANNILFLVFPIILIIISILEIQRKGRSVRNIMASLSGIFYITIPLAILPALLNSNNQLITEVSDFVRLIRGKVFILGFILFIWSNDTFAYITGSLLGKHKLAPNISPAKTVEGFIGGILLTVALAIVISLYWFDLTLTGWIGYALIVVFFGTFGDLLESWLKRKFGIKDSGTIMPGHGGILDRLDSILLASPFAILYLLIILNT